MYKKSLALLALVVFWTTGNVVQAQSERSVRPASHSSTRSARVGVPSRWEGGPRQRNVSNVSHETYVDGEVIYEGGPVYDAGPGFDGGCDSCGGGGCDSCGPGVSAGLCSGCNAPHRFCLCMPSHGWVHAEYLNWYASGLRLPALVTTSPEGTARADAGVMGNPSTSILFGNDKYLAEDQSGFRIRFGWWLDAFPGLGLEGEYFGLGENTTTFFQQSTGTPILARPFFNALAGREDAELVAFPDVVSGSIAAMATTEFDGAAFRFRKQLCCSTGCGFSEICCQTVPTSSRLDGTFGFRFYELDDTVIVREDLSSLQTNDPGSFEIMDRFKTKNQFNGSEFGILWQGRRGCWSLDALMRVAMGNVRQTVTIDGATTIVEGGNSTDFETGFLAQRTNIGTYEQDKFTMVPEFGLTLGYQWTKRLRLTAGYSMIYWGNVVRAGDQIDLDVNPNLLAPELTPFTGPLRPQFRFVETDYLVQGLSLGAELRW